MKLFGEHLTIVGISVVFGFIFGFGIGGYVTLEDKAEDHMEKEKKVWSPLVECVHEKCTVIINSTACRKEEE